MVLDQPLRASRPDVAQRGEVGDLPVAVGGVQRQRPLSAELAPVAGVRLPVPADLGALRPAPRWATGPTEGKALVRVGVAYLEHRVAVLLAAKTTPRTSTVPEKSVASVSNRVAAPLTLEN